MEERNNTVKEQYGFGANNKTVHQLINLTNEIIMHGNMRKTTTVLNLDLEKDLDLVW